MNAKDLTLLSGFVKNSKNRINIDIHDVDPKNVPDHFDFAHVSNDGERIVYRYQPREYGSTITLFADAPIVTWYYSGMKMSKWNSPIEVKNEKNQAPLVSVIRSLQDGMEQNWFDRAHAEKVCTERGIDLKFLDYDFNEQLPF